MQDKKLILKELQQIPGIGKSLAHDLYDLGYTSIVSLKNQDPELMYVLHNKAKGSVHDICVLYTFRAAVYYAETLGKKQDPEKLKWWNWMDKKKMTSVEKDAEIRKRIDQDSSE